MEFYCPACHTGTLPFTEHAKTLRCDNNGCAREYPVCKGVPVLICEERSLFSLDDFVSGDGVTTMDVRMAQPVGFGARLKSILSRMLPDKSRSICDYRPTDMLVDLLEENAAAHVLVIGAGEASFGPQAGVNLVYSDVTVGPVTDVVADAHDLPFAGDAFDAVIAVAVIEHVVDPYRVAAEVTRVLKPNGIVYANTPFMQQVHLGRYDFTRFTHLGHRFLWRRFDEIRSGVSNGPGMVISWGVEYFIRSAVTSKKLESLILYPARLLTWPFRFADKFLGNKQGSYDGASAYYFVGKKRDTALSDREMLQTYRGKQG